MSAFSYHTIQSSTEGIFKEKGSKFLAFTYPVESEADVKSKLDLLRKEYFGASHHCFAYILGADKKRFRAFDDGEPNHSAGDPILGQIRSKNITNVLVVVVRYFGGVKLGVSGLINSYKDAAEDALSKATIIEKEILRGISLRYDYNSTPEVMRLIKSFDLIIQEQKFEDLCILAANYKLRHESTLFEKLKLLIATGHSIQVDNPKFEI